MNISKCVLLFLFSFSLSACGPVVVPLVSYYQIGDSRLIKVLPAKTYLTILVSTPLADPGYQTSEMMYMLTPYQLSSYANNQWVAPPSQMLLPLFVQALRQTGYFFAVVSPPFIGVTNYRCETRLLKLRQEFFLSISQVRLTVQALLIKNSTNRIIASQLFEVLISAPSNNPYGGVLAANQAAAIISYRIALFCVAHTRENRSFNCF